MFAHLSECLHTCQNVSLGYISESGIVGSEDIDFKKSFKNSLII